MNENEFNLSLNPTMMLDSSGSLNSNVTGSSFQPYATAVGLYNERNELLMVAKMAKPLPLPSNTDVTILIRYDN